MSHRPSVVYLYDAITEKPSAPWPGARAWRPEPSRGGVSLSVRQHSLSRVLLVAHGGASRRRVSGLFLRSGYPREIATALFDPGLVVVWRVRTLSIDLDDVAPYEM